VRRDGRALGVAVNIGRRLTETAVWHGGRCNWIGARPVRTARALVQAALGSDLYGGTSGVAWFLAELFAATDDTEVRRTALGAIEQALFFVSNEVPADGLYRGRLGVAVAAARIGTLLRAHGLLDRAAAIAAASAPQAIDYGFDLISGRAGGIIGHLIMHAIVGDAGRAERAVTLADELCDLDIRDDRWSRTIPKFGAMARASRRRCR
jgi:class II lanthipeptide synthase